ncbi:Peroxidasin [Melipona quadrifasciata]|uniref:Peroxidasin n=1 Tax=Melipona quadrifasciata TaxID=166423 RepID=A0A0M8ZUX8_9HYME|nr:Peroxidasin [Melipona quadrifasciata]
MIQFDFTRDGNDEAVGTQNGQHTGIIRSGVNRSTAIGAIKCGKHAGMQMRTCSGKRVLLVLLSSGLSKSATNYEIPQSSDAKLSSAVRPTNDPTFHESNQDDPEPIETLFIPEDPSEYERILLYVRRLFQPAEESIDSFDREVPKDLGKHPIDDEDRFSRLEDVRGRDSGPSEREEGEEKYLQRNPEGGVSPRTTTESNRKDEVVSMERRNYDASYDEKDEPDEKDLLEAANFGLDAMRDLYNIKEPMLYSMGLYLDSDNPARHLAVFNDQTEEARTLAKFPNTPADSLLSRRSQSNPLRRNCPNRGVPNCPAASLRYRTSDGSCNNLQHLWWGSAMSTMQRLLPPVYDDGIQSIRKSVTGRPLPSARLVSTVIHEDKDIPLESVTHMLMQWGQFVDHDLTATGQSRGFNGTVPQCCLKHPECLPISVSTQDKQLSQVTSYLDASAVYSSNAFQSDALRLFRNGLLQYGKIESQRPVLPKLDSDLCRRGSLSTNCFRAGDGRLGEQPALTSLHVAFLRLHNRIATKLAALNAHWSDEKLFQESRRIVAAIVQHITYREFLPIVLGQSVMKIFDLELLKKGYYKGYDPTVNPTIANGFSTAAYRFGHSLVQQSFVRFTSDHQPIFNNVSIHNEFTNPVNLETAGSVDRLILGLINQNAQRRDEHINEELTNHLFQTPSFPFGMDLASINIQRGRDHGIPPYVQWRKPCALSPIKNFDDLERAVPPSAVTKLRSVYSSVEDIDLFTGGLAEKSVRGGLVGPTFACIIGQQFSNIRRGDRFWYENSRQEGSFTPGQLQQIRRVTLAQVLCATMDNIETLQPFVFLTQDTLKNQRVSCNDPVIGQLNLQFWAERLPEFKRLGIFDKIKKNTSTNANAPANSSTNNLNPPKTNVHQQNKIVVKKPFGPSDNVTIIVQNNAINSPVFLNDAIHGSSIMVNPSLNQQTQQNAVPTFPPMRPVIITHPLGGPIFKNDIYVPYAFRDPNNPNPLSQGYRSGYDSDVVFDSFPGSSPRPTLYTYYTTFQKMTTQRPPQDVNAYTVNYKPQDHGSKFASSRPNSQYQSQLWLKPVYASLENNTDQENRINIWQKVQYRPVVSVNQQASSNLLSYTSENPQNYLKNTEDKYVSSSQQDYSSNQQVYSNDSANKHTTWPSVSFDKKTEDKVTNDQHYRPYQKPTEIDYASSYQTEFPIRPTTSLNNKGSSTINPNTVHINSSARPVTSDEESNGSHNTISHSTPIYRPAQQISDYLASKPGNFYQTVKPSKIHSVTIVTESTVSEGERDIDRIGNRVTSIPRPLVHQAGNNRVRKPGQYYYEKNVLHRYPDKIDDQTDYNAEQRHKTTSNETLIDQILSETSVRNHQVIDGNRNNTDVEIMDHTINESFDGAVKNELAESTRGQKSTISSGNAKNPIKQNHCRQGTTKTHEAQKLRLLTISPLTISISRYQ